MDTTERQTFGEQLRAYRRSVGLTQEELAERAEISPRALLYLERDERRPQPGTARRLADALGLDGPDRRSFLDAALGHQPAALQDRVRPAEPQVEKLPPTEAAVAPVVPRYPLPTDDPLIGRESELLTIVGALPSTPEAPIAPRLMVLPAEAGMGKTRLLAEAASLARAQGLITLAGGAYEQEGRLPYGPIHDALLDYVQQQPESLVRRRLDSVMPDLVRILPELQRFGIQPAQPGDPDSQRLRLFLAIAGALRHMSRDAPVLLLLDDLHWADDPTLQVLHFLLRQSELDRLLILAACRGEEVRDSGTLRELLSDSQVSVIDLGPLEEGPFAQMLEMRLGGPCMPGLLETLYERSGGNPFFAVQILQLLLQTGGLAWGNEGWQIAGSVDALMPGAVRDTIMRRLRLLSADERDVVMLGAILGTEFEHAALEALWDGGERQLRQAVDAATAAHVLAATTVGYAFHHPLLWEVVYSKTPGPQRARLHERAALRLETLYGGQAGDHAAELARHFLAAGRTQADRAVRYLVLAGEQAEGVFAYEEAERQYRTALELALDRNEREFEAAVLEKLGGVLILRGRYEEALERCEEAVGIYRSEDDPSGVARTAALLAWAHNSQGTPREGLACILPLLGELENQPLSLSIANLFLRVGFLSRVTGEYMQALPLLEHTVDLAERLGDDWLLFEAQLERQVVLMHLGLTREGFVAWDEMVRRADALGDPGLLVEALAEATLWSIGRGEFAAAREHAERALELLRHVRHAPPSAVAFSLAILGYTAIATGHWMEADAYLNEAADLVQSTGGAMGGSPWLDSGLLWLWRGEWEKAEEHLQRGAAGAEGGVGGQYLAAERLAQLDLLRGQPKAAVARLAPVMDEPGVRVTALLPVLATAHLEMGDVEKAEECVESAIRRATETDQVTTVIDALHVRAKVLSRQRRWEAAARIFDDVLSRYRALGMPYHEALVLEDSASMHLQRGKPEKARRQLEDARVIVERLGAKKNLERIEQALKTLPFYAPHSSLPTT